MKKDELEEMGFANIDQYRAKRTGAPEAVFCPGKKPRQIAEIMKALTKENEGNIIATRATENDYAAVKKVLPRAVYFEEAGIIIEVEHTVKAVTALPDVVLQDVNAVDRGNSEDGIALEIQLRLAVALLDHR